MVQYSKEFLQEYYDVEWLKYYDLIPDAVIISESDYDYYWRCKRVECSGNTDTIVEQMNNPSLYSKPTKRISLFEEHEKRRKS